MESEPSSEVPVTCDLSTLDAAQGKKHETLLDELLSTIRSGRELSNGYEFVLPDEQNWYVKLAEWVILERLCCPFLSFEQGVDQNGIWLRLTGDQNAKQFLKTTLEPVVRDRIASRSG